MPNTGPEMKEDQGNLIGGALEAMVGMRRGSFSLSTHLSMDKSGVLDMAFFFYGSTDTKAFVLQSFVQFPYSTSSRA